MNVRNAIANEIVERDGIHYLEGCGEFAYNDGDQAEAYLLRAIRDAGDISSRSRELEARIKDWVSRYHFSRSRSLAYQSLEIPDSASVLEIGSGSGSITRLLGERAGSVLAIEGSARRAAMTRLRTRDQQNVAVLCAAFERVRFTQQFDIIVCNGVLEYASMFMSGNDAAEKMVGMFAQLLNPTGTLLVAIENKFGLRYFSSTREEHTGVAFDGLEGYARHPKGPKTFGRAELEVLLRKSFAAVEFLLPLPDYKFPQAIARECLLREVDCSELFASMGNCKSRTDFRPLMHERLVWGQLGLNRQLAIFSNSFFVLAGHAPTLLLQPSWRGDVYAINRSPGLEVRTRIEINADASVSTQKSYTGIAPTMPGPFRHRLETAGWVEGESVHTAISRAMLAKTNASLEDRLQPSVTQWWSAVIDRERTCEEHAISGAAVDLNWENSILQAGQVRFIDSEWVVDHPMPANWFLYRTVSKFVDAEWNYRHRWDARWRNASKRRLLKAVGSLINVEFSLPTIWQSIRLEGEFQRFATDSSRRNLRVFIEDCTPFSWGYCWKEWRQRLGQFMGRVARNIHRLSPVRR